MRVDLQLPGRAAQVVFIGTVLKVCAILLYFVLSDFVAGALADPFIAVTPGAPLASFITDPFTGDGANPLVFDAIGRYIPDSPRLHYKLANSEQSGSDSDLRSAELHAVRAAQLSPYDFRPRLLLARIQDQKEDRRAEEESLRAALQLSPRNVEAHYLLGTLLLSQGKFDESFREFQPAISGYPPYLNAALDRVWTESHENVDAVRAITPDDAKDRLTLARFLLKQARPLESAAVFRQTDRNELLRDRESGQYLDSLIAAGQVSLAHELWGALVDHESPSGPSGIWNGGFEGDILLDFAQFDWAIQPGKYAMVSIDTGIAHTGQRSLRVDFLGHETTRLEDEIKQVLLLRPGRHFRLDYYVKTENLTAPEGPRVAVTSKNSKQWIAASDPAPEGSQDWQPRTLEFKAADGPLVVSIQQRPKFSYEPPTHGTVWFDDFDIREIR